MGPLIEKRLSAFHALNKAESAALRALGGPARTAEKDQQILAANQPSDRTILIHRGRAMIYRDLSDGRRQIMQFCLPGDLVDPCSLLAKRRDFSIAAISRLTFSDVSLNELTSLISQHPHLALPLLWNEARDIYLLRRHLLGVGRMTAKERLAALFLEIYERLSMVGHATGGSFKLYANQKILGDATGLSAVHVSRTMQSMEREELIERSGGTLTIDREGLHRLVPDMLEIRPRA